MQNAVDNITCSVDFYYFCAFVLFFGFITFVPAKNCTNYHTLAYVLIDDSLIRRYAFRANYFTTPRWNSDASTVLEFPNKVSSLQTDVDRFVRYLETFYII